MRNVNNTYLCQAKIILNNKKINLSHKRLRRLAYIDVHQLNYNLFSLYNSTKKLLLAMHQKIKLLYYLLL